MNSKNFLNLIAQGFSSGQFRKAATTLVLAGATLSLQAPIAKAEQSTSEKAEGAGRDAKKKLKRKGRKAKKEVRDATGNSSVKEDAKDTVNNVKDEVKGN